MINSVELQEILERLTRVDSPESVDYLRDVLENISIYSQNTIEEGSPVTSEEVFELLHSDEIDSSEYQILEAAVKNQNADKEILKIILEKVSLLKKLEEVTSVLEEVAKSQNADKEILKIVLEKTKCLNDQWSERYILPGIISHEKVDLPILYEILEIAEGFEDEQFKASLLEAVASHEKVDLPILYEILEILEGFEDEKSEEYVLEAVRERASHLNEVDKAIILGIVADMSNQEEVAPSASSSWVEKVSSGSKKRSLGE